MKVEITSNSVGKMQLATKVDDNGELMVKISVESQLHPSDIARLLNLQKNKAALFFTVGSQQAEMDLDFFTIKSEKLAKPQPPSDLKECPTCHGKCSTLDQDLKIDVACPTCRGTGVVPVSSQPSAEQTKTAPATEAPKDLVATVPVDQVEAEGSGNGTNPSPAPKRRSRKAQQASIL